MRFASCLRIVRTALSISAFAAAVAVPARADSPSTGKCGDDVRWTFCPDQSKLVIEGVGQMYDYSISDERWGRNLSNPDSSIVVEIGEGVTSVGECAFSDCPSITSVSLPDSVTEIENWSFLNCKNIESITIPYSVSKLEYNAFDVSFYNEGGQKLDNTADGLRGHRFEKKDGKLLARGQATEVA